MSQEIYSLDTTKEVRDIIPKMQKTIESGLSNLSGTTFPTTNLIVGMQCYRTDLKEMYELTSISPIVWVKLLSNSDVANNKTTAPSTPVDINKILKTESDGWLRVYRAEAQYFYANSPLEAKAPTKIFASYDNYIRAINPANVSVGTATNADKLDNIDSAGFIRQGLGKVADFNATGNKGIYDAQSSANGLGIPYGCFVALHGGGGQMYFATQHAQGTEPKLFFRNGFDGARFSNWATMASTSYVDSVLITDGALNLRKKSTAYSIGNIAYDRNLPSWARLECVVAGKTSASEIVIPANLSGVGYLADGACKWIIDDIRLQMTVGEVKGMMYVPSGCVKIAGATVNRSDYIRLVNLANKYGLWTTDPVNNPGKFGVGNGSTTMVLPDWRGVVRRFLDEGKGYDAGRALGSFQGDAIRNITGNVGNVHGALPHPTAPFIIDGQYLPIASGNAEGFVRVKMDLSKSVPTALENRMRNIAEMAVMRY